MQLIVQTSGLSVGNYYFTERPVDSSDVKGNDFGGKHDCLIICKWNKKSVVCNWKQRNIYVDYVNKEQTSPGFGAGDVGEQQLC